ncbi:monovalent cation/H+ antiporter subunit D [Enterovirga rhinocerotis]|uniref:Multisubunit potassium/proton antiporter PhaD subunit n=1 Tax=Enterovirga rhinocerotis TaxID=1339210 RepID=A0A4V3DXP9_9HYPH|nr:monovalent cation/H+ antiporter subunit D [Enterovirga rhinocerotis]TDR89599.1 multisubunit potassium/proton antiporter PhaD subunit [Enterovirga rhinocerotis]
MTFADHLVIAPIVLPTVAAGLMLMLDGRSRNALAAINLISTFALLAIAITLAATAASGEPGTAIRTYRLGDWPAQFGIVLVSDRLSSLMLVLTATLACAALVFSLARWHGVGPYFHPFFQFLLMGLNGAFLTGDVFNLFVFFEVLLAASYGLALYGSGYARVRAGLHYIAINLVASLIFLIGASLIYGSAGTLNMADLAVRVAELGPRDRALLEAGASILGVVFLVKAAMWPLGFWLPGTYAAAGAPVAALFAIMTKVGIYAVLRLGSILTGPETEGSVMFGAGWLTAGGAATIVFAMLGLLASQELGKLAGYAVVISSGTLLAVIGAGDPALVGPALFYLVSSTLAISAFFLLIELVERGRTRVDDVLAVTLEAYGLEGEEEPGEDGDSGIAVPAILAVLGVAFVLCGVLLAGLPPLSGFVAKFAILAAAIGRGEAGVSPDAWLLLVVLLLSGFVTLFAVVRGGMRSFWGPIEREVPHVRIVELAPIAALLFLCVVLTVKAEPAMRFMQATAADLRGSKAYSGAVLAEPVPPPAPPREGGSR